MPIYEYKCNQCGDFIERMQRISDAPLTVCESCGGKLEKQISRSGFQFKGDGWYVTDYAGKKGSSSGKTSSGGSTGSDSGASNESAVKEAVAKKE